MLRQISILFLAAAVLFSAVGANVYELFCCCEHLHQISIFEQHHTCEHKKQAPAKSNCCLEKSTKAQKQTPQSANFHKKSCCDFKSKYLQIDAKYYAFKGIKTEKTKKIRNFTPKKDHKNNLNFSKNMAQLAAFSEPPAYVAAQRLARILRVSKPRSFESSKRPYGRQLRVRLASFLC